MSIVKVVRKKKKCVTCNARKLRFFIKIFLKSFSCVSNGLVVCETSP